MDGTKRSELMAGMMVQVVQKHHQRTGELTEGVIAVLLTKSSFHPHGIKVRLESGVVGRVKAVMRE
ncbi:MAG: YwbE family protein [Candidatus Fermentibacteraceae bacterium]|nr:YwbE family protein [Candidatus Fermentibacteraceae bacterium]